MYYITCDVILETENASLDFIVSRYWEKSIWGLLGNSTISPNFSLRKKMWEFWIKTAAQIFNRALKNNT